LTAGGGVWWRLSQSRPDDFEERSKSGILVALASGSVLTAYVALDPAWDSMKTFMLVLWVVALVAVPLILLSSVGRRVVISLMVLYHFGGILTATTAVQLPNNTPLPWVPTYAWHTFYKNYLTFTYLNNAYHFYSPEPGPPSLVWFQVIFEDGSTHWNRVVRREDLATRQQYQRMLSLTESLNQPQFVSMGKLAVLQTRRAAVVNGAAKWKDPTVRETPPILPSPNLSLEQQYREPAQQARDYLKSYAKYVCMNTTSTVNPALKVKSVRVYKMTHHLISADQLKAGLKPTDPTFFWAFFYGEYEYHPEANDPKDRIVLKGSPYLEKDTKIAWVEPMPNGAFRQVEEDVQDPYLFWMLPIYRKLKDGADVGSPNLNDYDLVDGLFMHSGDKIDWDK